MQFLIVLAILSAVVVVVLWPVLHTDRRAGVRDAAAPDDTGVRVAELAAARDAKYREIRDAELDHRTGKLSDGDYEAVDGALRAEAIEIVHALDALSESDAGREAKGLVGTARDVKSSATIEAR
jgi:hypothetical protein